MSLSFGDIVLLRFPFTDQNKSKKRPALVLAYTEDNDIIVYRITSQLYDSTFDFKIEHWEESGLKLPSVIRLHKIATIEQEIVDKKLGRINEELVARIEATFLKLLKK